MSSLDEPADLAAPPIRTRTENACPVCGGVGETAYAGLRDRLFGVAGEWTLRRCLDGDCGLLWLDPMPVEADLPRLYENYYTHAPTGAGGLRQALKRSYLLARHGLARDLDRRSRLLARLVTLIPGLRTQFDLAAFELPVKRGGRLLEIGCANGSAMRHLAEIGWQVEGVDFDAAAVAIARSNGFEVRLGSVEAQAYPTDRFDAIVMSHVLEHVPDPQAFLAECRRILKPNGQLVSITPNAAGWGHKTFRRHWLGLDPPRHLHIFTPQSLRKVARSAGFSGTAVKSSIGSSGGTLWGSWNLWRKGRYEMITGLGAGSELIVRLCQAVAALRHSFSPGDSDELVLHAIKDG